jgi:hypothetical protein
MLAYLFWHRPAGAVAVQDYEAAAERFHASLAAHRPGGFIASACLRAAELDWLAGGGPGYEDWYLVEDYAALGVLNEAAVGHGHLTAHDAAARLAADGTGGLYRLLEGGADLAGVALATWITPTRGAHVVAIEEFLGDGMDPEHASLWRRALTLGPAPEYCLLTKAAAEGTSATRLPHGWHARSYARAAI